jgi:hypothetical protein
MILLRTNINHPQFRFTGRSHVSLRELKGNRLLVHMEGKIFIFHFDMKKRGRDSLDFLSQDGLFISFNV